MSVTSLSLVIAAYNVEAYIREALESVRLQVVPFNEVVIINDGSTDGTLEIIKEYSDLPGYRVITTTNKGLGAARNLGARVASSEYLMFLDSDDYTDTNLVYSFLEAYSQDPLIDLYVYSFVAFEDSDQGQLSRHTHQYPSESTGRGDEIFADLIRDSNFFSASWSFIFRKSLINWSMNGFYNILHEDEEFTPRLFIRSKRVVLTPKIFYYYRQRPGSIMNSSGNTRFIRSRIGYFVALLSNLRLLLFSIGNQQLFAALYMRTGYLSYHAFIPLYYWCVGSFVALIRKCIPRY